jgi:hypothetical protein
MREWEIRWNDNWQEKVEVLGMAGRETCYNTVMYATDSTWFAPGVTPGICNEIAASDRRKYVTTYNIPDAFMNHRFG